METLNKLVKWLVGTTTGVGVLIGANLFFIGTPIVMYWIYIGTKITTDAERWAQFGDFFGGTLGPILSLLTLIVTIYIAFTLSKLDDERSEKAIAFEKRRFLNELREGEYKRIVASLNRTVQILGDGSIIKQDDRRAAYYKIIMEYDLFLHTNEHLFPFLKEKVCSDVRTSLEEIARVSDKQRIVDAELTAAYRAFGKSFKLFVDTTQRYITDNM